MASLSVFPRVAKVNTAVNEFAEMVRSEAKTYRTGDEIDETIDAVLCDLAGEIDRSGARTPDELEAVREHRRGLPSKMLYIMTVHRADSDYPTTDAFVAWSDEEAAAQAREWINSAAGREVEILTAEVHRLVPGKLFEAVPAGEPVFSYANSDRWNAR